MFHTVQEICNLGWISRLDMELMASASEWAMNVFDGAL